MENIKLLCNAKLNLTLDICGRLDNGYHTLDSVMQSVSLADTLSVTKADNISVLCSNADISGESNIAYKAAKEFLSFADISGGAKIYIEKNIPLVSGMGGGSSDAAGVIIALDKLYGTNLSEAELFKIALRVGSDVPFCIVGGTKRVEGIGECISNAPPLKNGAFLIVKSGKKSSTAEMYKKIDALKNTCFKTNDMINALVGGELDLIANNLGNNFEAVCDKTDIKNRLLSLGAKGACLTGSGPTVFGIFESKQQAQKAMESLNINNAFCFVAVPAEKSIEIIN